MSVTIAPGVEVIVRDWLNANHVLIKGREECVLIDSGYVAHAHETLALVGKALDGHRLDRLVNTHCHSDHMGGNSALAAAHGCPILLPVEAARLIDAWDTRELLLDYADQRAERFAWTGTITDGEHLRLGELEWQALSAPGHDMTALVFYQPEHRLLVSGDALWERGFGLIEPVDRLAARLAAQRTTLERIAALDVAIVVPGHGAPFRDAGKALDHAFQRLASYEADPVRLARHCLKTFLVFALLAHGPIPTANLPAYLARVPCYGEYNAQFFRLAPVQLSALIAGELLRAGVLVERGDTLCAR